MLPALLGVELYPRNSWRKLEMSSPLLVLLSHLIYLFLTLCRHSFFSLLNGAPSLFSLSFQIYKNSYTAYFMIYDVENEWVNRNFLSKSFPAFFFFMIFSSIEFFLPTPTMKIYISLMTFRIQLREAERENDCWHTVQWVPTNRLNSPVTNYEDRRWCHYTTEREKERKEIHSSINSCSVLFRDIGIFLQTLRVVVQLTKKNNWRKSIEFVT